MCEGQKQEHVDGRSEWLLHLVGDALDIEALKPLARACDATIQPGPDGRYCLGGARFEARETFGEAKADAETVLKYLNGLARLRNSDHRTVSLDGTAILRSPDGRRHRFMAPGTGEYRLRGGTGFTFAPPSTTGDTSTPVVDAETAASLRMLADPKLFSILEWLADEPTWSRLRGAMEKVLDAMGKKPKAFNFLVSEGYATQEEMDCFRANTLDPRVGGINAVHGVPDRAEAKGVAWTERQGLELIARILKEYVSRSHGAPIR